MRNIQLIAVIFIVFGLGSCRLDDQTFLGCTRSLGPIVEDSFFMGDFDGIKACNGELIEIRQESFFSILVLAPESIMPIVNLDNRNGLLEIDYDDCLDNGAGSDVTIVISMPTLRTIDISNNTELVGVNTFVVDDLDIRLRDVGLVDLVVNANTIDVNAKNRSELFLRGICGSAEYRLRDDTEVEAFDLISEFSDVDVANGAELYLTALELLEGRIRDSGEVFFKGLPFIDVIIEDAGHLVDAN